MTSHLIYAAYAKCKIQMAYAAYAKIQNTNDFFKEKVRKYKINKTIIEFGSRGIWGIIKASVCVICLSLQPSALVRPLAFHLWGSEFDPQ